MFILQTTTAILIAFLALVAYNEVRNRLAKGRSRRKDLETPGSPTIPTTNDVKPPPQDANLEKDHVLETTRLSNEELERYKQIYYKLHRLENHPEILPECNELLLSLLSSTIVDAVKEPGNGILSVKRFSRESLDEFLKAKDVDVTNRWEEYLSRRRAGGSREVVAQASSASQIR